MKPRAYVRAASLITAARKPLRLTAFGLPFFGHLLCGTALATSALQLETGLLQNLSRPEYEPRVVTLGNMVLLPQIVITRTHDDNIFVSRDNRVQDTFKNYLPSLGFQRDSRGFSLSGDAYADARKYDNHPNEDVTTFGGEATFNYTLGHASSLIATARLQRSFLRREEPEAGTATNVHPALFNLFSDDLIYQYKPGRAGVQEEVTISKIDFLDIADKDRNLTNYRAATRGSLSVSEHLDLFLEGYGDRRDAPLPVDRNGLNRDMDTWGLNIGTKVMAAERWSGEFGIGVFRANPADVTLHSFSGLAYSGNITWRPRTRTAITANLFRGNVATVQAGASGRIDTRIDIDIEQEVRHNLLIGASFGYHRAGYRGASSAQKTTLPVEIGAEYLLNRYVALSVDYSHADRTASDPSKEFTRDLLQAGLRLRM